MIQIITLSGLDGSGKSTQAKKLQQYLSQQGHRVYYFHVVEFSLAQRITKIGKSKKSSPAKAASAPKAGWLGVWLRRLILQIDLWRFRLLLKKLERQDYDVLLADRYFYDSLINIAYLAAEETLPRYRLITPTQAFYLRMNPAQIMKRSRQPDQGLAYLEQKQQLLESLAKEQRLIIIDADQAPETVFKDIVKQLRI